ncbi:hypothetical protein MXB_47 [Myxobolus squamalis]|nr:hypothetical protein MXB_47 [Myxobolus squamalis]
MNPNSKIRRDLSATERQEMLINYDELVKPTHQEALETFGISQSMFCRLLRERENAILLPAPINKGRKRKRMGKDEEVEIALKLWLESMQSRGSRIIGAVLKEKAEDFERRLG